MNTVAIVAIVAMLLAFMSLGMDIRHDSVHNYGHYAPEAILYISPPQTMLLGLTLPDRNPKR